MSRPRSARRRPTRSVLVSLTLGLYVCVLVVGAAEHHDLACHLKSATHCTSCLHASVPGAEAPSAVMSAYLTPAGRVNPEAAVRWIALFGRALTDRSPPAC